MLQCRQPGTPGQGSPAVLHPIPTLRVRSVLGSRTGYGRLSLGSSKGREGALSPARGLRVARAEPSSGQQKPWDRTGCRGWCTGTPQHTGYQPRTETRFCFQPRELRAPCAPAALRRAPHRAGEPLSRHPLACAPVQQTPNAPVLTEHPSAV